MCSTPKVIGHLSKQVRRDWGKGYKSGWTLAQLWGPMRTNTAHGLKITWKAKRNYALVYYTPNNHLQIIFYEVIKDWRGQKWWPLNGVQQYEQIHFPVKELYKIIRTKTINALLSNSLIQTFISPTAFKNWQRILHYIKPVMQHVKSEVVSTDHICTFQFGNFADK